MHGEFFTHLFYFRDWVEQFQVDQVDYNRIRISLVPNSKVDDDDVEDINTKIRLVMGADCEVEWLYVDSIEKRCRESFFIRAASSTSHLLSKNDLTIKGH